MIDIIIWCLRQETRRWVTQGNLVYFKYHNADSMSEKNLSVNKNFIPRARVFVLT